MRKLYKILSCILIVCIYSVILPSSLIANAESTKKKITYVTTNDNILYNDEGIEKKNPKSDRIDILTDKVLWIDGEQVNNFKNKLIERYKKGLKTIIISDSLSKNDVRKHYGVKELPQNSSIIDNKDFEKATQIATVAYKSKDLDIIAGVKVIDVNDKEHALIHATEYDYSRLYNSTFEAAEPATLAESGYSWRIANSDIDSVSGYGVDLDASLQLYYDTYSPDGSGYYYYYTKLISEAAGQNGASYVGLCRTRTSGTSSTSKILEYGPPNQTVSDGSNVSFTLGYGIGSITYTPDSKVSISKYSGGINYSSVEVRHQPVGAFGQSVKTDYLRSELHYVARDTSSSYQANSTATAEGTSSTIGVNLSASR